MIWQVSKEQIIEFMTKENAMFFDELKLKAVIEQAIPIYTRKNPNPKSGKEDCRITVREKEHFRTVMKMKLEAAKTEQGRSKIIDHYTNLFNER
jgi:hypothetical protein